VQRADTAAGLMAQRAVEDVLIMFAVWLVEKRDVQPKTAKAYVSTVRAWHARRYGEMLPGFVAMRLKAVLKGMKRVRQVRGRRRRRGVRTQLLAQALAQSLGESLDDATLRAACETAFCGLLRVSEYTVRGKGRFNKGKLPTVGDVAFSKDEEGALLATVMVSPSKKGDKSKGKSVPVQLRDGTMLRPATSLLRMLRMRRAQPDEPLFVYKGEPLRAATMSSVVKWLMQSVGEDPAAYASHSLRIGGASAALAGGVPPEVIRIMGRWDSAVYEIYCRLSRQAACKVGATVASTAFNDFEGEFANEELL